MARSDVESCSSSGGARAAAEARIFVIESKTIPLAAIGKKERRDVGSELAGSQDLYRGRLWEIPCAERPIGRCAWRVHPCTDGDCAVSRRGKFQALNLTTNRRKSLLWHVACAGTHSLTRLHTSPQLGDGTCFSF